MSTQVDDEMLMAAADGELDSEQTAEILRLAERDPTVAARLARYRRSREVVADAFAPLRNAPAPERLISATIRGGAGHALRRALALPIAAALVGVGVALGILLPNVISAPDTKRTGLLAAAAAVDWGTVLAQTPTGGELNLATAGRVLATRITGTYPTKRGDCRSFVVSSDAGQVNGMTCVNEFGWQTVVLLPATGDGYLTASGAVSGAIDTMLDRFGAEPSREPGDEAQRILDGWR